MKEKNPQSMSNPFKKKYRERKRNNNNKTPARH